MPVASAGGKPSAEREAQQALVSELYPGSTLIRARRLRGGLSATMHALETRDPSGERRGLVLRRYSPHNHWITPQKASNEFRTLQVLQEAGVPASRPIWFDAGERFGVPSMLLSYVPGRPVLVPRRMDPWLREFSNGLLQVHAVTPDRFDLSFLEHRDAASERRRLAEAPKPSLAADPLAQRVVKTLSNALDVIDWPAPTLVHGDYWPGNVIMNRGRLSGVIDWPAVGLGNPLYDVAQGRVDLALIHDLETADAFLDLYRASSSVHLRHLWFFDLSVALHCLEWLPVYNHWLKGYHDFGLTHITYEIADARLHAFTERALVQAGA